MDDHNTAIAPIDVEVVEVRNGGTVPYGDTVHPLVQQAMEQAPGPETLHKLLDVQDRWEKRAAQRAFNDAMATMKKELPVVITRDKKVEFKQAKYTFASIGQVVEAVAPVLVKYGFDFFWETSNEPQWVQVVCVITHRGGHERRNPLGSPPDMSGAKGKAQAVASTVTLLERYTLCAALGIVTADMPEPEKTDEQQAPKTAPVDADIDEGQNLRALGFISKQGHTKAEAEAVVNKPVDEWGTGDLAKLRAWLKKERSSTAASPPPEQPEVEREREPGEDDGRDFELGQEGTD